MTIADMYEKLVQYVCCCLKSYITEFVTHGNSFNIMTGIIWMSFAQKLPATRTVWSRIPFVSTAVLNDDQK